MKKTLGKILIIITFAINLFANVDATVSAPAIYKGESINFIISADGDKIIFPTIDEIDSNTIEGISSSQSTTVINGNMSRKVSKIYSFFPQKSLTIPSFEVNVDGKTYKTKEIKVAVLKQTVNKKGSNFIVQINADKKEAYIGESINLTISFKQKLDEHVDKVQLGEPKLENFWVKQVENVEKSNEGEYIVQKIQYILFPQKAGEYTIPSIEADIGKVSRTTRGRGIFDDPFFDSFATKLKWQKIFSNQLSLKIKPLPNNLELFGSYQIEASIDKKKVHANKPVNLTIKIKGKGNIDDIKKFDLDIDNAIIYADEPKISSNLVNGIYQGEFTQKIAIIADSNYTIEPISLKYFDKESKEIKTIQTKSIDIEVKSGIKMTSKPSIEVSHDSNIKDFKNNIETKSVALQNKQSYIKYLFLILGLLLGIGLSYIFGRRKKGNLKVEQDIVKSIKKTKTDRALFELLLPYSQKNKVISNALGKLEENIYKNSNHKIDKVELMDFFEEEDEEQST